MIVMVRGQAHQFEQRNLPGIEGRSVSLEQGRPDDRPQRRRLSTKSSSAAIPKSRPRTAKDLISPQLLKSSRILPLLIRYRLTKIMQDSLVGPVQF
jgi:hypothetical protein